MALTTVNPATGDVLEVVEPHDDDAIEARLARAAQARDAARRSSIEDRAAWARTAASLLDAEVDDVARLMTLEMGKTITSARAEVRKCAMALRFYAEHAGAFLAEEQLADPGAVGASRAGTRYEPLGVVLAVMPWNFPLWQVVRFAAPALVAGNVVLLKHASNVPGCARYLEDLFGRAGFGEGAFQALLIGADRVEAVLRDARVAAATVTGSEAAGRAVASVCGEEIKKTVLELGGSDPFVVMPSADVELAASAAVTARCQNNGQSCIAAKRFIVHDGVFEAFADAFVAGMSALVVGDPLEEDTELGPLATSAGRDELAGLVDDALAKGASALCGGRAPEGPGWFYEATVLVDVTPEMAIFSEEAFGPVAVLHRVADLDEAIALANATSFGLGSNAWTQDPDEEARLVAELDAGAVFVNGMTTSYPELAFGGIKRSGYGRELAAIGMREFCNLKTVWVR